MPAATAGREKGTDEIPPQSLQGTDLINTLILDILPPEL